MSVATYTTKFSLGQRVWIVQGFNSRRLIKCRACQETGKIRIGREEFVCPKCHGRTCTPEYTGCKWMVEDYRDSIVGQIQITHIDHKYLYQNEKDSEALPKVKYMLSSHGVRSGNVWNEEDLFGSEEEANAECELRNKGINFEDEEGIQKKEALI